MAASTIPLNIVIGDRNYRIKILQKDEETVRKTLKLINDKIIEFRTQFAGKDMQDYIAMVLIWYATQLQTKDVSSLNDSALRDALLNLEEKIDKSLR